MTKRTVWTGVLLALVLALTLAVLPASAAEPAVLTLEADAVLDAVTFPAAGEALILDLNGHTLTPADPSATVTTALAGALTVRDSSAGQTGKLTACRFQINAGGALTLEGGALTGCSMTNSGAAVWVNPGGTLTMTGGAITGNRTSGSNSGGAVVVVGGTFTLSGGSISGNSSGSNGGAVAVTAKDGVPGSFTMSGGSIADNRSTNLGGAVWITGGGSFTMTGGTISGNESLATAQANARGGAVYISKGSFTMTDGVISGNAAASAGAVGVAEGTFTMSGGSLTGNKAGLRDAEGQLTGAVGIGGGAVGVWSITGVVDVTGGVISDNTAYSQGGAISVYAGEATLKNVTVSGNKLAKAGACYGGAFLVGGTTSSATEEAKLHRLTIGEGTLVTGNGSSAEIPGGSYLYGSAGFAGRGGEIVMTGGTVTGNDHDKANGVFHLWGSSAGHMTMSGGEIAGNSGRAGAVWIAAGADFTMTGGSITGNTSASIAGGGVFLYDAGSSFTMTGGSITGNTAQAQPGGGVAVRGGTFTMAGGEICNNASATIKCDLYLYSTAPRFTMTGGVLGARNSGQNAFWAWNGDGSNTAYADFAGGTVDGEIGASGTNDANHIHLWSGNFAGLADTHRDVTVYGGDFFNPVYLAEQAGRENVVLSYSGREDFGYRLAPAAEHQVAVNAAGTALEASFDAGEAAWTYSSGVETTETRLPVTARLTVGSRTTDALALTAADGRYALSVPLIASDLGSQYRLTLLDADGEPIRAFAGHISSVGASGPDGDLNGDEKLNAKDVVTLQRAVAGGYGVTLTLEQADLNGDGKLNAKDSVLLQRAVAGGYGVTLGGEAATDDPRADDELNLLFIGNSFCYYWPDELYGLLTEAGYQNVTICNVYYSGCTLTQHWNWFLTDQANYEFWANDATGRHLVAKDTDLRSCVAYKNWDTIEMQQGGSYLRTQDDGGATYRAYTFAYLPLLYRYLSEQAPLADFYWQHSWAYEVDYPDDLITNAEEQQARCDLVRDVCQEICQRYGFTYSPNGDAWQTVRHDARYDELFAVNGRHMTTRIYNGNLYDDLYHDGDVGGGQYLNACVWFETLTRTSCVGSAYRPQYVLNGTDYSLSEEQIAILQNAAHQAVLNIYGTDFYQP